MTTDNVPPGGASPSTVLGRSDQSAAPPYVCEVTKRGCMAIELREALLRQRDEWIRRQKVLSEEADHRLLNDLQMVSSVLMLQSRGASNAEATSQLAAAATRVTMIASIHRRLHYLDSVKSVAFKQYLEDLCGDFTTMLSADQRVKKPIVVEAIEVDLVSSIGIPIGFIVSELITNAVKHGDGGIVVRLEARSPKGYALSVTNDGQDLPEGFDPAASQGVGMRIIQSFVQQIGGKLHCGRSKANHGAQFTVTFT